MAGGPAGRPGSIRGAASLPGWVGAPGGPARLPAEGSATSHVAFPLE